MKKKHFGYTLIETLLVIALISIITIVIYNVYQKRQTKVLISSQLNLIKSLDTAVNRSFASTGAIPNLNVNSAIQAGVVPNEMLDASRSQILNLWNGNITFDISRPPYYGIIINGIPNDVCNGITTSNFAANSQDIVINGTNIKPNGEKFSANTVNMAAATCDSNSNSNTIVFFNKMYNNNYVPNPGQDSGRNKEDPYYIQTTGAPNIISGAVSCIGGTTWTGSYCSCPVNTRWDGKNCIADFSKPGACPDNQGWDGLACAPLPPLKTGYTPPYSTVAEATANAGSKYVNGRYIPNSVNTQLAQVSVGSACEARNASGQKTGYFDGKTCQTCINGFWNGFRCETPP